MAKIVEEKMKVKKVKSEEEKKKLQLEISKLVAESKGGIILLTTSLHDGCMEIKIIGKNLFRHCRLEIESIEDLDRKDYS